MKTTGLILSFASALLAAFPLAVRADVVPPRRPSPEAEAVQISEQMARAGAVSPAAPIDLTVAEIEYFSARPERIQLVGGLHTEEAMAGVFLVGLVGFMYFRFISEWP